MARTVATCRTFPLFSNPRLRTIPDAFFSNSSLAWSRLAYIVGLHLLDRSRHFRDVPNIKLDKDAAQTSNTMGVHMDVFSVRKVHPDGLYTQSKSTRLKPAQGALFCPVELG